MAYIDRVLQFVRTHSKETMIAQVEGRMIDFSMVMVGKHLKLPSDGPLVEEMHGLTKQQHNELFSGEFPRTPKGCQFDNS